VTSGASGDIEQATKLARHMVCNWGMSPMGPIAYGDNQDTVFLGREITRSHTVSEETARRIDAEVKVLVDESYTRARQIIVEHRTALDKIADALLAHETIDGVHVKEIVEFGEIRSPIVREAPATPPKADDRGGKKAADSAAAPDALGTPAPSPHPA
jgi:cell division protease FtsH